MLGLAGVTLIDCKVGGGAPEAATKVAMRVAHPELIFWVNVAE